MILNFDDYKNSIHFDNDEYLMESMAISNEVDETSRKFIDYVNTHFDDMHNVGSDEHNGIPYDAYLFVDFVFNIFDCPCEIKIVFANFTEDKQMADNLKTEARIESGVRFVNGLSEVGFVLRGNLILYDGKLTNESNGVIAHEFRHAYVANKVYGGCKKSVLDKKIELEKKWRNIYNTTTSYIDKYKNDENIREEDGDDFMNLMFMLYQSDVSEIAAFTQQAYEVCKGCKTEEEIKVKLHNTGLYRMKSTFGLISKILSDESICSNYDNVKMKRGYSQLPSIKSLESLISKRYKKAKRNYGYVYTLLIDELENDDEYEVIDIKY